MGNLNGYTEHHYQEPPRAKRLTTPVAILLAVLGSVLLICGIGSCTALLAETPAPQPTVTITQTVKPGAGPSSPAASPSPPTSPSPSSPAVDPPPGDGDGARPAVATKAPVEILGTDLVHVGEDVPPGTYRVVERVTADPWCYWAKYGDSEGDDIISNDIVKAGRPQVTLKKGQWFKSAGCPDWRKK